MEFLKVSVILFLLSLNTFAVKDDVPDISEVLPEDLVEKPNRTQLVFDNELDNVIAPFTYQSSLILLGGAALTYIIYNDRFEEERNRRFGTKEGTETWREIGDFLGWGPLPIGYSLIQYYHYQQTDDDQYLGNIEYMGKSVAYTALTTFALKMTIDERRPKDKLKKDSFPSGHASSGFAFSTAVWLQHGWEWGLFSSALASWVSYSRIYDGSHYIHDSVIGAALGAAYAIGIYNNHYLRDLPFLISLQPTDNLKGLQAGLTMEF